MNASESNKTTRFIADELKNVSTRNRRIYLTIRQMKISILKENSCTSLDFNKLISNSTK